MKTSISLPAGLLRSADALAHRLGISRSQLYATALAEYLAKHQAAKVTERLNSVYGSGPSGADESLRRAQRRTIARTEW